MQIYPTLLDCIFDAGAELEPAGPLREHERPADLLDVDPSVDRLDAGGELEELARSGFRIANDRFSVCFIEMLSGTGLCSRLWIISSS